MPEQPSPDEQNEIKKRAVRRVIVASVLVAAAIAGLTVLTRYKPEVPVTRTTTQGTVLPPIKQPEPAAPTAEENVAPPEQEAQPAMPPPPPPEVVNAPPISPALRTTKPMPAKTGAEAEVSARPAPAKPVQEAPPPATTKPVEAAPKGYTVQLGVFSNPANALQLQEKLAQNGIKSHTETKLNVGPFQSKAEADQALAKIRALGIGAVVVPVR